MEATLNKPSHVLKFEDLQNQEIYLTQALKFVTDTRDLHLSHQKALKQVDEGRAKFQEALDIISREMNHMGPRAHVWYLDQCHIGGKK